MADEKKKHFKNEQIKREEVWSLSEYRMSNGFCKIQTKRVLVLKGDYDNLKNIAIEGFYLNTIWIISFLQF